MSIPREESEEQPCQPSLTELAAQVQQATQPLTGLQAVASLKSALKEVENELVAQARVAGLSYAVIGDALGVSRQAVAKRGSSSATDGSSSRRERPRSAGWTVSTPAGRALARIQQGTPSPLPRERSKSLRAAWREIVRKRF